MLGYFEQLRGEFQGELATFKGVLFFSEVISCGLWSVKKLSHPSVFAISLAAELKISTTAVYQWLPEAVEDPHYLRKHILIRS